MGKLRVQVRILVGVAAAACLAACAASEGEGAGAAELRVPHIAALSAYEASIGTLIEVYGEDFADRRTGKTMVVFRGSFDAADGTSFPVDEAFEATFIDSGTVRWTGFGPYRVPFGPGDRIGTFHGEVVAQLVTGDGTVYEDDEPMPVSFEVKPSILVHELQPVTASCGGPITRALGGAPYRMRVQALGFEPETFTYTIAAPAVEGFEPVSIRHVATGPFDSVGEYGDFMMPQVPEEELAYGAVLTVQATDSTGAFHQSAFALGVHRPLEIFYNGNVTVAEILAPTPVSACTPGGEAGRVVTYQESMTETRSRSYTMSWNESWLRSHTVSSSSSSTIGVSESNGVGFATTDGESFRWEVGAEVGGEIGLSQLAKVGFKSHVNVGGERRRDVTNSANRETGLNASETTTDTETAGESVGGGEAEAFSWQVSSSETIGSGFGGNVIAGTYGVFYRQTIRLQRQAVLVTYNQCGAAQVVGEVDFTDWTWSPDLALGTSCPPLPQSNLPPAECIISPCLGE